MTEAEWLACTDPKPMLDFLRGRATSRKLRLLAADGCRRLWGLLAEPSRTAVGIAERYAEGQAGKAELKEAFAGAWRAVREAGPGPGLDAAHAVAQSVYGRTSTTATTAHYVARLTGRADEMGHLCALVRCAFGNPFRPSRIDPSWPAWNGGTVVQLAQVIYDERAFDRLPILADALEDAGCHDAGILAHCRGPGSHVRGCWVVDALLGKK
jgi:hypothetical protein